MSIVALGISATVQLAFEALILLNMLPPILTAKCRLGVPDGFHQLHVRMLDMLEFTLPQVVIHSATQRMHLRGRSLRHHLVYNVLVRLSRAVEKHAAYFILSAFLTAAKRLINKLVDHVCLQ